MKSLKFTPELCALILDGEKTATLRLFDDKDLQIGDELTLINKETLTPFGTAIITSLDVKTLGTLTDSDWEGNERFSSKEAMYQAYRSFYGDAVSPTTEVKVLQFVFTPSDQD